MELVKLVRLEERIVIPIGILAYQLLPAPSMPGGAPFSAL